MHYALPPRKSANPPPWTSKTQRSRLFKRYGWRAPAILLLAGFSFLYLLLRLFRHGDHGGEGGQVYTKAPWPHPNVVVVTAVSPDWGRELTGLVLDNRRVYAQRHGYQTHFANTTDYPITDSPQSWAKIPAVRHAMTLYPHTPYFLYLDPYTVIMNPSLSLESHVMDTKRLEALMRHDVPIIPPDSVIKTFPGVRAGSVDFVLAQDGEGLLVNSFVVRRGEWAKYFLDAWFDPLYRSYNFQKAERHALEHIVQWHGTLLAKLALVPQNVLSSYTDKDASIAAENGIYKEGDFALYVGGCEASKDRNCESELRRWLGKVSKESAAS